MLPPAVDVEFYGDKAANPPNPAEVEQELGALLEGLEAQYGIVPIIYATEESWNLYIRGRFDRYPLWIRNVKQSPAPRGNHGCCGSIPTASVLGDMRERRHSLI